MTGLTCETVGVSAFRVGFVPGVMPDNWKRIWGERRRRPLELMVIEESHQEEAIRSGEVDMCLVRGSIGRDGMHSGINIAATVKLAQALTIPVIASGGLSNMADIEQLCAVEDEGVEGVICGRAIYSGDLDFAAAQARADELGNAA